MRKIIISIFLVLIFLCSCSKVNETEEYWVNKSNALWDGHKYTDPQKAIEYLDNAIKLKPDYAEAHRNLGVTYGMLGRYQDAVDAYKQTIKFKPDLAEAHYNLGVIYYKLGQRIIIEWQKAKIDFNPYKKWVDFWEED